MVSDDTRTNYVDPLTGAGPVTGATLNDLPQPPVIGVYRLVRRLGEGGMGIVYAAEQRSPSRTVALKVIRGGQFVDDLHVRMFQREAETLARLKHPDIAAIYEAGRTDDGQHYFAMGGVMLYEALSGARPYDTGSGLIDALRVICEEPPRPLRQAWRSPVRLDPDLATIVGKALAKRRTPRSTTRARSRWANRWPADPTRRGRCSTRTRSTTTRSCSRLRGGGPAEGLPGSVDTSSSWTADR